ncbi:helix-turn-helix transcriptional regulator [Candidatus Solirubrobacter pratensis]|uniref:helix-turn-helix transcriptional regulator n=1 Tax=Candidatus Solirubrobacter pratensis TaxID=1298857 RepID=UPI000487C53E|nr:helix-turn-helix transcriptional regulator [Candidatus Solirubrobacter pratensis]
MTLAHRVWAGIEGGTEDARALGAAAGTALEGGLLLDHVRERSAFTLCARALTLTGDAAGAARAIGALREEATARGSLRLRAAASSLAAELALRTGSMIEAEHQARLALGAVPGEGLDAVTGGAVEVLLCALAERGAFAEAGGLLREHGLDDALDDSIWKAGVRHARARLRLAEGDFERAYADAAGAGRLREAQRSPNPALTPWRSTAALALAHLGRRAEAARLASAELAPAERFGASQPIAAALHARAVAEADREARAALCKRGLALAAGLESVRLRLELGSTLASLGRRLEAREALRPALADADAAGAALLARRARRELAATGLRPRQAALDGAAALTPRQRQICELAAAGKGNRAIAQELFLSVKTVETHLAAGFRKLGVSARSQLAGHI